MRHCQKRKAARIKKFQKQKKTHKKVVELAQHPDLRGEELAAYVAKQLSLRQLKHVIDNTKLYDSVASSGGILRAVQTELVDRQLIASKQ